MAGFLDNVFGGLSNSLYGQAPNFNPNTGEGQSAQMNPQSAQQVQQMENQLTGTTPQQYTQQIMQGTGAAQTLQNNAGAALSQEEQGGGGMPGMGQAINAKAAKNFATQQGRLQQNAQFQGQQMANNNMLTAVSNANAIQNAQTGINSALNNLQLQANQARFNTISSIMSGAGSLGGALAANALTSSSQNMSTPYTNQNFTYSGETGNDLTPNPTDMGDYGFSNQNAYGMDTNAGGNYDYGSQL